MTLMMFWHFHAQSLTMTAILHYWTRWPIFYLFFKYRQTTIGVYATSTGIFMGGRTEYCTAKDVFASVYAKPEHEAGYWFWLSARPSRFAFMTCGFIMGSSSGSGRLDDVDIGYIYPGESQVYV
jgi:hypothetical protein